MINENSVVNIDQNHLCTPFKTTIASPAKTNPYPYCFFQYISSTNFENNIKDGKILINFYCNGYDDNNRKCILNQQIKHTYYQLPTVTPVIIQHFTSP